MKVTIFGYGNIGSAFTKQLTQAGHEVIVSGRDLAKARDLATQYGAQALSIKEAAPTCWSWRCTSALWWTSSPRPAACPARSWSTRPTR
nr:NAD(P)-binding domain-containing protein [Pseudomonas lopnurensis]